MTNPDNEGDAYRIGFEQGREAVRQAWKEFLPTIRLMVDNGKSLEDVQIAWAAYVEAHVKYRYE